jgi:hypothetical protein
MLTTPGPSSRRGQSTSAGQLEDREDAHRSFAVCSVGARPSGQLIVRPAPGSMQNVLPEAPLTSLHLLATRHPAQAAPKTTDASNRAVMAMNLKDCIPPLPSHTMCLAF